MLVVPMYFLFFKSNVSIMLRCASHTLVPIHTRRMLSRSRPRSPFLGVGSPGGPTDRAWYSSNTPTSSCGFLILIGPGKARYENDSCSARSGTRRGSEGLVAKRGGERSG